MKWVGYVSTFLLIQLGFALFFLFATGRVPEHELSLLVEAVKTGKSVKDAPPPAEADSAKAKQDVSFDDYVLLRTLQEREIDRKRRELESLEKLVSEGQESLTSAKQAIGKLSDQLKKAASSKEEEAIKQGQRKVLDLLESSQPKVARGFLMSLRDDEMAIEFIRQLDPSVAAKVFKEFKQPKDQEKLNGWLEKLGEGEPESSRVRALKKELEKAIGGRGQTKKSP